jgi:hypothetical protein
VDHLKGASLGPAQASPANIRLGWRGLPGTNTLAYYENPEIMAVKSFILQAPVERENDKKVFFNKDKKHVPFPAKQSF